MKILILCTQWGMQDKPLEEYFSKAIASGFDGIDTWIPEGQAEQRKFLQLLNRYGLPFVCHQYQPSGNTVKEYCRSADYYLNLALEGGPLFINSQSGRDYFTIEEQLEVLDMMQDFSVKKNVTIVHETHRGRMAFSPYNAMELFIRRPEMKITADFSHWVCVTESYLEHSPAIMDEAIRRTDHIHARIGHTEGPQVTDPRANEWQEAKDVFLGWWDKIVQHKTSKGDPLLTITPEFGPSPYMTSLPGTNKPIADQFELNNYMRSLLRERYAAEEKSYGNHTYS